MSGSLAALAVWGAFLIGFLVGAFWAGRDRERDCERAYRDGWADREAELLTGIDRTFGP